MPLGGVFSQTVFNEATLPYRRVFIPEKQIGEQQIENLVPIDAKELEELKAQYEQRMATLSAEQQDNKSKLLSAHYVARLVGADLLSERSRLVLDKSIVSEYVTLQPWTIAVNPRSVNGIASSITANDGGPRVDTSTWTFDEQGVPRIPAFPIGADPIVGSLERESDQVTHWFGWSARSDTNSLPNKLLFSFAVPKCADSCLLLALPPQAVIQDSLTVVQRIDYWNQLAGRLGPWSELAKRSLDTQNPVRAPESLWLIELGGNQRVSFSISLSSGSQPFASEAVNEAYRYSQLIKSQRLDHVVDPYQIRTICDAEVLVSTNPQSICRLSLAPGSRLRRLMVNQQEVDWQVFNGWIQWNATAQRKDAADNFSSASSMRVNAEFVTPVAMDKLSEIQLPRIAFDRGYVMAGNTSVHTSEPWVLTNADCESCQTIEKSTAATESRSIPLEYAWHAFPPELRVGLKREIGNRSSESVVRFSQSEQGLTSTIRTKILLRDQDTNEVVLQVRQGWEVRSASALAVNDPVTVVTSVPENATSERGPTIQLAWDRIQRTRTCEIELQLFKK
jgi:hypothetical protein